MSTEEKERKERILSKAEELFLQHGYSRVTMEEIASSLGISKKTLYRFFPNKEAVVRELISKRQCETMDHIDQIYNREDLDFIGKFRTVLDFIGGRLNKIERFQELQKLVPELWEEMHSFKKKSMLERVRQILASGFESGVLRGDLDRDVVVLLYANAVESLMTPEVLSELPYNGPQLFEVISRIIFEGILTEEGREKYNSFARGASIATGEKEPDEKAAIEDHN